MSEIEPSDALQVRRLQPEHAGAVVACFRRVYGDSYGNPLFYDVEALQQAMTSGALCCVGALAADGRLLGHMAMSLSAPGDTPELGNTVVDPEARGAGVAWQVGAALTDWCRELGHVGFLHYPTANHHIMQRQSVKRGFETGLMLGYIPAETDGQVGAASAALRQAATIVYEPLAAASMLDSYLSEYGDSFIRDCADACGLPRNWLRSQAHTDCIDSAITVKRMARRDLVRCTVTAIGQDIDAHLSRLDSEQASCIQLDLCMSDPALELAVTAARGVGFMFCGWLPGFRRGDVLRLQKVVPSVTDLQPQLVNATARQLLDWIAP